jgi:hypothetical protein
LILPQLWNRIRKLVIFIFSKHFLGESRGLVVKAEDSQLWVRTLAPYTGWCKRSWLLQITMEK